MTEYIEREKVLSKAAPVEGCFSDMISAYDVIMLPTADVAPVRHGRWGTHSDRPDSLICSVCNCGFDMWKHDPHNYCPNCGAKMDGGRLIEELNHLRDELYEQDLISMKGLKQLNMLIEKYTIDQG